MSGESAQVAEAATAATELVEAVVVEVDSPDRVVVRTATGDSVAARVAAFAPYRPTEGDRILLLGRYVVGALRVAQTALLQAPDGASAGLHDGALEIRDPAGRLVFRYAEGACSVLAPDGDLTLAAPRGRVAIEAGLDLTLSAGRDLVEQPAREARIEVGGATRQSVDAKRVRWRHDAVEIEAKRGRLTVGRATVVANHVATTAQSLVSRVERYELEAERIVERSRDAFRSYRDLLQTKAGRVRTRVTGAFSLSSRRTDLVSDDDTTIDGKRVLLG